MATTAMPAFLASLGVGSAGRELAVFAGIKEDSSRH